MRHGLTHLDHQSAVETILEIGLIKSLAYPGYTSTPMAAAQNRAEYGEEWFVPPQ